MTVYLTFDVEVWCNGWEDLDARFPASFERYVFGRSAAGEYGLPQTLGILSRCGLRGVFFVEPLFAARFGQEHLQLIVDMIHSHGQEVQLHLHPEWTDEIRPPLIADVSRKRQHLAYYAFEEQLALIAHGRQMLIRAGCTQVSGFRAGSFAADRQTYAALSRLGVRHDSSVDVSVAVSCADMRDRVALHRPFSIDGVAVHPMSVFRDGFGRLRHAQVGACSFGELRQGLERAHGAGAREFVILSHNFELLKPGSTEPDWIVVKRFTRLCEYLANEFDRFRTAGFSDADKGDPSATVDAIPKVDAWATGVRYFEQAWRRL